MGGGGGGGRMNPNTPLMTGGLLGGGGGGGGRGKCLLRMFMCDGKAFHCERSTHWNFESPPPPPSSRYRLNYEIE